MGGGSRWVGGGGVLGGISKGGGTGEGCACERRGAAGGGKAGSIASGPWGPAGPFPMRPSPCRIDAGAVRSARGLRRLQRAVTLQRLFQVAAQRRAVLGLLFEDGLLAQQVAVLALDIVAKGLVHRLGLQLQVGAIGRAHV